jgi:hypothetical protein
LNKFLERILNRFKPVLTNGKFWRILVELEKPYKVPTIQPTSSARPKGFEKVTDDFQSRVKEQKVLNERDSKLFILHEKHLGKVKS